MSTVKLEIKYDQDALNPRKDWDNIAKLAYFHKRYDFVNESGVSADEANSYDELCQLITKRVDAVHIVPVYMYAHSGLAFKAGGVRSGQFACPWDSGIVGFAYITREGARELFGVKRLRLNAERYKRMQEIIEGDVEIYSDYINGNCYHFTLEVDGKEIEDLATGTFFGDHDKSGLRDEVPEICRCLVDEIQYGPGEAEMEIAEEEATWI